MGVQGLWQLLQPAGKPVSPQSLEGKILAVDVSIWLHQTMKGMRDKDGNPLPNAHLQGLFSRVCKLLFYRIKPVFVFDGGVPALKKQTMAVRRERKEAANQEKGKTNEKLLRNLLKSHALQDLTGDSTKIVVPAKPGTEPDMFHLPPLSEVDKGSVDPLDSAAAWEADSEYGDGIPFHSYQEDLDHFQNLADIDFDSEEFRTLPLEIQHEILTEMKEQRRETALARIAIMPEESANFSDYQLKKLLKQSTLTGRIESLRKEMNKKTSGDITYALGDDYYGEVVEAQRVVSEDAAHYILIKGLTRKQQAAEAERCKTGSMKKEKDEKPSMNRGEPVDELDAELEIEEAIHRETEHKKMDCASTASSSFSLTSKRDTALPGLQAIPEIDDEEAFVDEEEIHHTRNSKRNRRILSGDEEGAGTGFGDGTSTMRNVGKRNRQVDSDDGSGDDSLKRRRRERGKAIVTRSGVLRVVKKSTRSKTEMKTASEAVIFDISYHEKGGDDTEIEGKVKTATAVCEMSEKEIGGGDDRESRISNTNKPEHPVTMVSDNNQNETIVKPKLEAASVITDALNLKAERQLLDSKPQNELDEQNREVQLEEEETLNEDFDETRSKLLAEEEDLLKAKEAKMAALLKSLEKRTQAFKPPQLEKNHADSAIVEASLSAKGNKHEDEAKQMDLSVEKSLEETREKLTEEEEELAKLKNEKMAALLKAVESRSQTQTNIDKVSEHNKEERCSLPSQEETLSNKRKSNKKENDNEGCKKRNKQTRGFLEDVVSLENKVVERKTMANESRKGIKEKDPKSAEENVSADLTTAYPALTADYLEDVECVMEEGEEEEECVLEAENSDVEADFSTVKDTPSSLLSSNRNTDSIDVEGKTRAYSKAKSDRQGAAVNSESKHKGGDLLHPEESGTGQRGVVLAASQRSADGKVAAAHERTSSSEDSESEDEGFIEITIDPTKVGSDELFPASIFDSGSTETENDIKPPQNHQDTTASKTRKQSGGMKRNTAESEDIVEESPCSVLNSVRSQQKWNQNSIERSACKRNEKMRTEQNWQHCLSGSESPTELQKSCHFDVSADNVLEVVGSSPIPGHGQQERTAVPKVDTVSRQESKESASSVGESSVGDDGERDGEVVMDSTLTDEKLTNFTKGVNSLSDLYDLQRDLATERHTLTTERGKQARLGKSITEQINIEAQELLQLFGIPYIVSPMEAEAQCAYLELMGLTQGTITDDSDCWLFGATNIYKNFFNQGKYVEYYSADAIFHRLGLERRKLINIALLCGSDYTPGIAGVGPVRAMEVMAEFPGDGLEGLRAFREWWEDARDGVLPVRQGKVKSKLKTLQLHDGFPSRQVVDAYLHPPVDESEEGFMWGLPDLELLRQYSKQKFGWKKEKADEALEPMMKELTKKMSQGRIHRYFQPENFLPPKPVKSKRLQAALDKFQAQGSSSGSESESGSESDSQSDISEQDSDQEQSKMLKSESGRKGKGSGARGRGRGGARGQSSRGGQGQRSRSCGVTKPGKMQKAETDRKTAEVSTPSESHDNFDVTVHVSPRSSKALDLHQTAARGEKGQKAARGGKGQKAARGGKGQKAARGEKRPSDISTLSAHAPTRSVRGRGKGRGKALAKAPEESRPRAAQQKQQCFLRDEVALSESSSSSETEELVPSSGKKAKMQPSKPATYKPDSQPKKQNSKSSAQPSAVALAQAKQLMKQSLPNVKQLLPGPTKMGPQKRKLQTEASTSTSRVRVQVVREEENTTAFKAATGGLDPSTMTLDDLGSDFSDEDFN